MKGELLCTVLKYTLNDHIPINRIPSMRPSCVCQNPLNCYSHMVIYLCWSLREQFLILAACQWEGEALMPLDASAVCLCVCVRSVGWIPSREAAWVVLARGSMRSGTDSGYWLLETATWIGVTLTGKTAKENIHWLPKKQLQPGFN